MPQARRIGHATFETPDLNREIDHWVDVAGLVLAERDGKRAYLATKVGQLVVELHEGQEARCSGLSFEVSPKVDLAAVAKDLADEGVSSALNNDTAPGLPRALVFEDNKGTKVQLFNEWNYLGDHHQVAGRGISPDAAIHAVGQEHQGGHHREQQCRQPQIAGAPGRAEAVAKAQPQRQQKGQAGHRHVMHEGDMAAMQAPTVHHRRDLTPIWQVFATTPGIQD